MKSSESAAAERTVATHWSELDRARESQELSRFIDEMTVEEQVGQLVQVNYDGPHVLERLREQVRAGRISSVINLVEADVAEELQRIAVSESRLGIPLLFGRDVIHGFRTVFPIPLGQAASWDPEGVRAAARIAAVEAAASGVNWTFAPMVDVSRDPRWGRVAESLGEDPYLAGRLAAAMVEGFQATDPTRVDSLLACAKHFAGYGASEAGRDYNSVNVSERELRDVHLPPFRATLEAGVASVMTAFSDIDGIPATAHRKLLRAILREEWGFDGFVVSDWLSIAELVTHGVARDAADAARQAARAGVDMDMVSSCYADHLASLIERGTVSRSRLDAMTRNVLRAKLRFGLDRRDPADLRGLAAPGCAEHLAQAYASAIASMVLLRNDGALPIDPDAVREIAVIGPLADDGHEQLGTWVFDGDPSLSVTPLAALRERLGDRVRIQHVRALRTTRSRDTEGFGPAVDAARRADVALLFLGEEAILSGEAHSRADIRLPGAQEALMHAVADTGTPVVAVVQSGRPLALSDVIDRAAAWLWAWHPGSMGGAAIADLLLGTASPAGKLPATFPRMSGQVPIYHARRNTGRPARDVVLIDDLPERAPQHSAGNVSFHLDAGTTPLFPFGHGLAYTIFRYDRIEATPPEFDADADIVLSARVTNAGDRPGTDVAQLYVRDLLASVARPVRELKGFVRVHLEPGESRTVRFRLTAADLAFHDSTLERVAEPGEFEAWIGGSSEAELAVRFTLRDGKVES